jgi:hypothetical protein
VLQGIQASCLSDVSLAFTVQVVSWRPAITTFVNPFTSDVPSEALAFLLFITRWAEAVCKYRSKLNLTPWLPFRSYCFVNSENVAGTAGANAFINSKEGIAVDPLLTRAGWNLAI